MQPEICVTVRSPKGTKIVVLEICLRYLSSVKCFRWLTIPARHYTRKFLYLSSCPPNFTSGSFLGKDNDHVLQPYDYIV